MRMLTSVSHALQPLARKLPFLIAALLCVVVGTYGSLVTRELRHASEAAAGQRLEFAAQRLASLLVESTAGMRMDLRRLAADTTVRAALERPSTKSADAVTGLLGSARQGSTQQVSRALWTARCELVSATGLLKNNAALAPCPGADAAFSADASSRERVEPLVAYGDTVLYTTTIPVLRASRDTAGYLVQVRSAVGGQAGGGISGLIGKDATVLLGNQTGAPVWTNFATRTEGPPPSALRGVATTYTPPGGSPRFGVALNIAATPWTVWVEMPKNTVMAAHQDTIWNLLIIALVCIAVGVLGAWAVSRRVTRPLGELTRAAEDIAAGNYGRRLTTTRDDELGQLMTSFNRMSEHVATANRELSHQAEELEHHFREAQDLAHELEISNQELIDAAEETLSAQLERSLAQSLLDEVLTQAPVGIAMFDEDLRYVRLNKALAAMNELPLPEHIGRTPDELPQQLCTISEKDLAMVVATGQTLSNLDATCVTQGKKRHWVTSYFPVRGEKGKVTGAGAIVLDMTTHADLESKLLQAQKMEAVGRLAGGVAHDFNNLLTVISSYSEMALETLSPDDSLYADMNEIRSSADRASRLTRQLLAFSRKQVLQPQVIDLNRVATDMDRMLRRLIGEDIVFSLDLATDLAEVCADPGQIEQVLMNLVLNGRDAMPNGGRLVIRTRNVSFSSALTLDATTVPPGEYVALSVSDTGTGMGDDTKSHLFEPFFTTKEAGLGTGLGLATVYGIVKQSGGEVHVHTEPGKGSTFITFLPRLLKRPGRHSMPGVVSDVSFTGSETILLVEDDTALRNLASRILTRAGYFVLEAKSGAAAIELGTTYPGTIDLLLTDVVMPHQSGRVVGERVSALRPGICVLFMSGYTDDDVMRRGVSTSHTEFLQKPFTPEQLTRRIREVLDSRLVRLAG